MGPSKRRLLALPNAGFTRGWAPCRFGPRRPVAAVIRTWDRSGPRAGLLVNGAGRQGSEVFGFHMTQTPKNVIFTASGGTTSPIAPALNGWNVAVITHMASKVSANRIRCVGRAELPGWLGQTAKRRAKVMLKAMFNRPGGRWTVS